MTNELTLRERVIDGWTGCGLFEVDYATAIKNISHLCDALEDTGSPAHMRVAAELRGE